MHSNQQYAKELAQNIRFSSFVAKDEAKLNRLVPLLLVGCILMRNHSLSSCVQSCPYLWPAASSSCLVAVCRRQRTFLEVCIPSVISCCTPFRPRTWLFSLSLSFVPKMKSCLSWPVILNSFKTFRYSLTVSFPSLEFISHLTTFKWGKPHPNVLWTVKKS